jgi:hypothetical protein
LGRHALSEGFFPLPISARKMTHDHFLLGDRLAVFPQQGKPPSFLPESHQQALSGPFSARAAIFMVCDTTGQRIGTAGIISCTLLSLRRFQH